MTKNQILSKLRADKHITDKEYKLLKDDKLIGEPNASDKAAAYEIVFNDLKNIPLFMGKYDGKNGNEHYMYGIASVMENIAYGISEEVHDAFDAEFVRNMIESENK